MKVAVKRCSVHDFLRFEHKVEQNPKRILYVSLCLKSIMAIYMPSTYNKVIGCDDSEKWCAGMKVARYLHTQKELCLTYNRNENEKVELEVYVDSDFGSITTDRKSTIRYIFKLGGGVINYISKKQLNVTLSSTEAEYVVACTATQSVIAFRSILSELGYDQEEPTIMKKDNAGCITIAGDYISNARM